MPDNRPSATTRWRKSSYSTIAECVEVTMLDDGLIGVRDSKDPGATMLAFTRAEMDAFVKGVKAGEFDDLT